MTVYFAGIDMPRAIDIRDRDKLHGMAEEVLSEDGEAKIEYYQSIEVKIKDAITIPFTRNIGAHDQTVIVDHNLNYT